MDDESRRALDDANVGDEVEVLYEYIVIERLNADQEMFLVGEFGGMQSAERVNDDGSIDRPQIHIELNVSDDVGSRSYFIPVRDIRTFRIVRRAGAKRNG